METWTIWEYKEVNEEFLTEQFKGTVPQHLKKHIFLWWPSTGGARSAKNIHLKNTTAMSPSRNHEDNPQKWWAAQCGNYFLSTELHPPYHLIEEKMHPLMWDKLLNINSVLRSWAVRLASPDSLSLIDARFHSSFGREKIVPSRNCSQQGRLRDVTVEFFKRIFFGASGTTSRVPFSPIIFKRMQTPIQLIPPKYSISQENHLDG